MLVACPYRIYDTGFLYSFTAVNVICCYQIIKPRMKGKWKKLKESVLFCMFIQIGMLPMMIYFQYETPIFSFVANLVAVPLATWCFTMAFLFMFLPRMIIHKGISYLVNMILWISKQSYGMLTVGHVPFLWVVLFYLVIFLCVKKQDWIKYQIKIILIYIGILILVMIPFT